MRPSNADAETVAHQDRRTSIWNSWYAAVLGLVPHPGDGHPGYEDWILTRECDRSAEVATAQARKAMADYRCGLRSC